MPNFFISLFKTTPKFVAGHKVESTKTVGGVMGESFDYLGSVRANSAFCKKLLKWCAREYSTQNVLFLLMCEKYKKNPSTALFNHIYTEFVQSGSPKEINISGKATLALTTVWKLGCPDASPVVFKDAISATTSNVGDSITRLINANFSTAFTLPEASQQREFDAAMAYLKTQSINLL